MTLEQRTSKLIEALLFAQISNVDPDDHETIMNRWRIERLLFELRYEVERGMMEREIDETITFGFFVPISQAIPDGVVRCEFRTFPVPRYYAAGEGCEPRLRLVKGAAVSSTERETP